MPTIDATTPTGVAAAVLASDRVREMCSHERYLVGARQVEAVSEMRLAARRLLAALWLFKKWLDPIAIQELDQYAHGVSLALRPVRNADASLLFFRHWRRDLHDHRERRLVQMFVNRITRARTLRREIMMETVEKLHLKRLSRDIDAFITIPGANETASHPSMLELARLVVRVRLKEVASLEPVARESKGTEAIPELRAALRRARLAVEILQPAFDLAHQKILRQIQNALAPVDELFDLNAFVDNLSRYERRWQDRRGARGGLERFRSLLDKLDLRKQNQVDRVLSSLESGQAAAVLQDCLRSLDREST